MRQRILVTAKTYPLPSTKYVELVCTAGITEDGKWMRLFPIDFRYKTYDQQFKLYDWIECDVQRRTEDSRIESYSPRSEIAVVGNIPSTNWEERKKCVMPLLDESVEGLMERCPQGISLGLIKPKEILDIKSELSDRDWTKDQKQALVQERLFGPKQKPLEKIPYDFKYRFRCHGASCKGNHYMRVEDWGLGVLYRKMRDLYGEKAGADKVIEKMKKETERDLHFFLGTVRSMHHYGTFTIIGLFSPPK
jgi:hypothetical protein